MVVALALPIGIQVDILTCSKTAKLFISSQTMFLSFFASNFIIFILCTFDNSVAQLDGIVDLTGYLKNLKLICPPFDPDNIIFQLYTREQPEKHDIILGDDKSLSESTYNASRPTKFVIHGWLQNANSWGIEIQKNYLTMQDVNVFKIQWFTYSQCDLTFLILVRVPQVAQVLCQFIQQLQQYGTSLDDIHLVGHSLGSHISGIAGKCLGSGKVSRISGLDPAGALYNLLPDHMKLVETDADFVQKIATDVGFFGIIEDDGLVNFYPNGGDLQPRCEILNEICNHESSVSYFAESILDGKSFCGTICDTYAAYKAGTCSSNENNYMGESATKEPSGRFFLTTNQDSPYGMGACDQNGTGDDTPMDDTPPDQNLINTIANVL